VALIPLFPLGTVLVPGQVMPLHIFEERYRTLVRHLAELTSDDERGFGVVAIRHGREVGEDGVEALFEVGCQALLRGIDPYPDGRFDIVTVGGPRFRILDLNAQEPYLQAEVEFLPETDGENAPTVAALVRAKFDVYRSVLTGEGQDGTEPLPDDPEELSWTVAASMLLDLDERQRILAADDTTTRLRLERELLHRETSLFELLPSIPAVDLPRIAMSAN